MMALNEVPLDNGATSTGWVAVGVDDAAVKR